MGYKKRAGSKTNEITEINEELTPENVPEPTPQPQEPEPEIDEAMKRKLEIAEKRRASLALARTKIIPKSTLKKQAEDAVKNATETIKEKQDETDAMRLKYERDRVKQLEDSLITLQKLIADKPAPVVSAPVPVAEPIKDKQPIPPKQPKRPSRSKLAIAERQAPQDAQPKQIIPKKSIEPKIVRPDNTETLIDKSYGEQLQQRLRSQAINKIMADTFGGF